ncbi:MAG: TRAP transporter small permease [Mogibacterium sp.]|nr:TRAP transporter small permease [Mogibacterium sp.]MBR2539905.1 TRAP transporter small permease [Mogibacterium sp.]
MKKFDKICEFINNIASAITVAMMVFLILLITWSVFSRFVLNSPVAWQYEATLVCLSWIVFIGMSMTFHNDEHMRLTFVANAMKTPKMRAIWLTIMDGFCFVFLVIAAYLSVSVIQNAMQTLYQTIPVPRGWFYLPFPIGAIFSLFQIINVGYKRIKNAETEAPVAAE